MKNDNELMKDFVEVVGLELGRQLLCTVKHRQHVDLIRLDPVNDPIRPLDHLPDGWTLIFRNYAPRPGEKSHLLRPTS